MELASTQSDLSQFVAMSLTNPVMLDTLVINEVKQHWPTTVDGRPLGSCWYCWISLLLRGWRILDSVESMSRHCWKYVMLVSFSGRESPSDTNTSEE